MVHPAVKAKTLILLTNTDTSVNNMTRRHFPKLPLLHKTNIANPGNASRSIIGHVDARRLKGFTLIELMVALALTAMLAGIATPMAMRMYDSMQYREALRGIGAAASSARYRAITSGRVMDLMIEPDVNRYAVARAGIPFNKIETKSVIDNLRIQMVSGGELGAIPGIGIIRFYPDGSSSGGSVTVWRPGGQGVRLRVDWLLGRVTQESLDLP